MDIHVSDLNLWNLGLSLATAWSHGCQTYLAFIILKSIICLLLVTSWIIIPTTCTHHTSEQNDEEPLQTVGTIQLTFNHSHCFICYPAVGISKKYQTECCYFPVFVLFRQVLLTMNISDFLFFFNWLGTNVGDALDIFFSVSNNDSLHSLMRLIRLIFTATTVTKWERRFCCTVYFCFVQTVRLPKRS